MDWVLGLQLRVLALLAWAIDIGFTFRAWQLRLNYAYKLWGGPYHRFRMLPATNGLRGPDCRASPKNTLI